MPGELAWEHVVQDIPEAGLAVERVASQGEREAIARALDLVACRSLTVLYSLAPRGGGHVQLSGTLDAEVEQTCVVTLEPLINRVAESFSVDYWPETEISEPRGGEVDMNDAPELEPIVAGRIAVGQVVFECLAGGIDLFPRKPGVTFDPPAAASEDGQRSGTPFSALAKIRGKQ